MAKKNSESEVEGNPPAGAPETAGAEDKIKSTVLELKYLRFMFQEISGHYTARIESEIEQIAKTVESLSESKLSKDQQKAISAILEAVKNIKPRLKPEKGRIRDLKRVDELVGSFNEMLEQWS